ncbi:MAG: hypothetical protein ACYCVH_10810 [Ignavibacteriaceae bacterium]
MQIKSVTNAVYFPKDLPGNAKKPKENIDAKGKDKLELSQEAQNIKKSQSQDKNLEEIKEKVQNKFYDSDDVINKTADKIISSINKK